jgi:PIN domain nuclease of toxin-antitoxin system
LVELGRLTLSLVVDEWLAAALADPGVQQLELTIPIIIQSTKLTGFRCDAADQIIVATAKIYGCPVLTADAKILVYPEVQTLK